MGTEERPASRQRRLKEVVRANDPYSHKSREWLRDRLLQDIKSVFVGALREVETHLGKGFPAYNNLRGAILRIGNDAIRDMHLAIDTVNVEYIPEQMITRDKESRQGEEDGSQENSEV